MSSQEALYYKIEAYLSGELDAGETAAFEEQISTDGLLKAEVEKHKIANALIIEQRLLSVKNILQQERIKDSGAASKPFGFIAMAVAAIGIGASVFFLTHDDEVVRTSAKQEKAAQSIDLANAAEKNENTDPAKQPENKFSQDAVTTDPGFHKHQIQLAEENIFVDERNPVSIDSAPINKSTEVHALPTERKNTVDHSTNVPADPCVNASVQATVRSIPSCSREATGNVLVQNIHGGTKPYSITLSSANGESVTNGALAKGIYQVAIMDAKGCVQTYADIIVDEKDCPKDYSFNPFYGDEAWYIDPENAERQLEIYDKGGALYFKKSIPALVSFKWTGMGLGNQIIPGYYIFVMKYADGTIQKGSVTIVQ